MDEKNIWLTIKDADGELRPKAVLWPTGEIQKYYQTEIDKYMKKATKDGCKLVKVEIKEIE